MPPLPSSSSDASLVTHEIQDRLLTKFRYLTDSLDLGLQCAACIWLFVEKDNVIRMLGEFWPDIVVILLVCSLVSFANQTFGIFVATHIPMASTASTQSLGPAGTTYFYSSHPVGLRLFTHLRFSPF